MAEPGRIAAPPFKSAVPVEEITGDDELDSKLLREMAEEAACFVRSYEWCVEVHEQFFGDGVGGVVALFLDRVSIRGSEAPEWIWVIVGDVPSVYLEFEGFPSPRAALERYIDGVEEWLTASPGERGSGDIMPIEVPSGQEWIEMLALRMKTLRTSILPHMRDS